MLYGKLIRNGRTTVGAHSTLRSVKLHKVIFRVVSLFRKMLMATDQLVNSKERYRATFMLLVAGRTDSTTLLSGQLSIFRMKGRQQLPLFA